LKVAEFKEKEKDLENTYDCGIDPSEFDEMNSKLPPRNDPQTLPQIRRYMGQ
jgi:hypothetical protein